MCGLLGVRDDAQRPWKRAHPRLRRDPLALYLVTHRADSTGRRAEEGHAGCFDGLGEWGILREKPVTWMDRLRSCPPHRLQDGTAVQVGGASGCAADTHCLVSHRHMGRASVRLGENGDGLDAESARSPLHTARNFTTICHQQLREEARRHRRPSSLLGVSLSLVSPCCFLGLIVHSWMLVLC